MAKRRVTLLALLIAVVTTGLFCLWRGLDGESAASLSAQSAQTADAAANAASAGTTPGELEASGIEAARARQVSDGAHASLQDGQLVSQSFALDRALWIEGSIAFPAGSPPDDTIQVLAIAAMKELTQDLLDPEHFPKAFAQREKFIESSCWSLAQVSSSGAFRIAVPMDMRGAQFYIDGRYLYMDAQSFTKEQASSPIVLQPKLGVWLVAQCVAPAKATAQDTAIGAAAQVYEETGSMFGGGSRGSRHTTTVGDDQRFEFRALHADVGHVLSVSPARLAGVRKAVDVARAGTKLEVSLEFQLGARITGRVVDEAGQGVAGALVVPQLAQARGPQFNRSTVRQDRNATSDADGSFELPGLLPGKTTLSVTLAGFVSARGEELELRDEQLVDGIVLTLRRGNLIAGRVTWPDGTPASGAELRASAVEPKPGPNQRGPRTARDDQRAKSAANGEFTISGLTDAPCLVSAWAERALPPATPDVAGTSASAGLAFTRPTEPLSFADEATVASLARAAGRVVDDGGPRATGLARWIAEQKDVGVGTKDLALVLAIPPGLRGRVLDKQGAPVVDFQIVVNPDWRAGASVGGPFGGREKFHSPDGSFLCPKVQSGRWNLDVTAKGFVHAGESVFIEVPQGDAPLVIEMARAATITGHVTDAAGKPIKDADVQAVVGGDTGFGRQEQLSSTKSDAQGGWVLDDLPPGSLALIAEHERWAKSEPMPVTLVEGEKVEGVALKLRTGGSISGEAFTADGGGASGRNVNSFSMNAGVARSARVDARGAFLIEHLTPGTYQVMLEPSPSEQESMASKMGDEPDMGAILSSLKMVSAEVKDGETTHVVLGAPPKAPVRLVGRVTERGKPVTSGSVTAASDGKGLAGLKSGKVGANGEYELTLDQPGNLSLSYQPKGGELAIRFVASVPEVPEFRFDLALPLGAIRGSVRGPDGAPLANVSVDLQEDDTFTSRMMRNFNSGRRTDESGRFSFEHLHAGTYAIAAGGPGMFDPAEATYGRAVRGNLKITGDGALDGVVVQLAQPGTLTGTVSDQGGSPIGGASIFVRDERGELVHRFSFIASDAGGKFTYRGLAPGRYTATARTATLAAPASPPVTVGENTAAQVELTAQTGTILRLSLEDGDGKGLQAAFSVRDEHDLDWSSMFGMTDIEKSISDGISTSEKRVGPLPPGKYKVKATTFDGREASKPVTLNGSDERKLKLRL